MSVKKQSTATLKPVGPWPIILEDDGWDHEVSTSIPQHGINDYQRIIKFEAKPTKQQVTALAWYLEQDHCPGWTGVKFYYVNNNTWRFHTTWDSSD